MDMTTKEIRKYLVFTKKNRIPKAEALHRLVTVNKLDRKHYDTVSAVAEQVYG